ncbi:hypothetical protein NEOC65_001378 [Neochlamydia sp. AcF65]|nr:hypothetical protein [Neochlamydia sp. AcF65]MBS4171630.1 hypothetical protein [Neochlamydia sp. AcF95]
MNNYLCNHILNKKLVFMVEASLEKRLIPFLAMQM